MYLSRILPALALAMCVAASPAKSSTSQPRALVYRGQSACKGCSEAVARLLEKSPQNFAVTYVGRDEEDQISAELLSQAAVYAQPGGPDLDQAYKELQPHEAQLRTFVKNGGRYLGFCLGAFLAGSTPGFRLLPPGANATPERKAPDAQVTGQEDTMIQVDWTFRRSSPRGASTSQNGDSGTGAGETAARRWLYFQDGAVITGLPRDDENTTVLGRYSSNGNVAASLTALGSGIVALVGPHPEATPDWYRAYRLENPDGIHYDIGFDFINAAMDAAPLPAGTGTGTSTGSTSTPGAAKPTSSSDESSWNASGKRRGRMTLQNPIGLAIQTLRSLWGDIF